MNQALYNSAGPAKLNRALTQNTTRVPSPTTQFGSFTHGFTRSHLSAVANGKANRTAGGKAYMSGCRG